MRFRDVELARAVILALPVWNRAERRRIRSGLSDRGEMFLHLFKRMKSGDARVLGWHLVMDAVCDKSFGEALGIDPERILAAVSRWRDEALAREAGKTLEQWDRVSYGEEAAQ